MLTQCADVRRLVLVRLNPGDDLLVSLREMVRELGIRSGVVLNGIGSLSRWDPERSLRGEALAHKSIQVGLSRQIIQRYVSEWTLEIKDYTSLVRKLYRLIQTGNAAKARALLPKERVYPLDSEIGRRIGMR